MTAVSDALGHDVRDLDDADALSSTVAAQLALFTVGVAATRILAEDDILPDAVAGHSIGAFAAAVTAGVITLEEGVQAVQLRAQVMQDLYPSGYGLLALLGARLVDVERLVAEVGGADDLFVAMENAEEQIVLAGSDAAFERVRASAAKYQIREIRRLEVAVPSHCALMEPVAQAVAGVFHSLPARRPVIRYVSAMTARSAMTSAAVVADLTGGVAHRVRWRDATDLLAELGTSVVVQLSPGRTTAVLFATAHSVIPVVALDDAPYADSRLRIRKLTRAPRCAAQGTDED
ncbi:malonate decarboxylase subunit epsilon [Leifsonia poae]|uniref:[acyl-carrier-protein] S-malonyltransferase n=2 Tax=Leifsonia poae TaxID=110933 RepID=A0A9W6HD19_9MICO|nr:malonyl CoA-acyl carrier protein transacylase [Leifsonia poae]